jgi:hypothetical protein
VPCPHPLKFAIWTHPSNAGGISPETGIFYPFIKDVLAADFKAVVIEPEHRFYGKSLPLGNASYSVAARELLTPQQALADAIALIEATKVLYNCTPRKTPLSLSHSLLKR